MTSIASHDVDVTAHHRAPYSIAGLKPSYSTSEIRFEFTGIFHARRPSYVIKTLINDLKIKMTEMVLNL